MTGEHGTIDDEELKDSAIATAKEAVAIAAARVRPYDEGTTTDKALWTELCDLARASINHNFQFAPAQIRNYLVNYPEIVHRNAGKGTIADSIKAAIVETIFDDVKADIAEVHAEQFSRSSLTEAKIWCDNGLRLIRSHGDAVSKNMHDIVSSLGGTPGESELVRAEELIDHIASRVEAHAAHQTSRDRPVYDTLARRLREARDLVGVKIDALEAARKVERAPSRMTP
jgi:hypothetical protein|nr:hypothetical protein [Neorhizobium tomejilense]